LQPEPLGSFSTSNSEKARGYDSASFGEIWRFFKAFAQLVLVPGVIAVGFVELVAWRTGAAITYSVHRIAEWQHLQPDTLWNGPSNLIGPLALARMEIEHPEVIVVGHSQCGQLRSMMFKPYSFYNACVSAWTFDQIRTFIDLATRSEGPKTIVFTLDYFMFGEQYAKTWEQTAFMDFSSDSPRSHVDGILTLEPFFKRYPLEMLRAMPSYLFGRARDPDEGLELLGPYAIALLSGFRSDGSVLYDPMTRSRSSINVTELPRLLGTVKDGDGKQPNEKQMRALKEIGELGRQRNVTLVGIQFPMAKAAVDVLDSDTDWNGYRAEDRAVWRWLQTTTTHEMLRAEGIQFFDWSHDPIAADPKVFIDPAHASEYGMGMSIVHAMRDDPEFRALFSRLDVPALEAALSNAMQKGHFFHVYGAQF
jgi:hypothetical protein